MITDFVAKNYGKVNTYGTPNSIQVTSKIHVTKNPTYIRFHQKVSTY